MTTKILFALALLAAVGMCEEPGLDLVMQEAEGYEEHLPDQEYYKAKFEIPKELAKNATNDVTLKLGFYFVHTDLDRRVTVHYNITNEDNESLSVNRKIDFDDDNIDGKALKLEGKCNKGCTVHFWFYADCGHTCVSDITSFFWARMMDGGKYIFSNFGEPYMPLYEGSWSPYFRNPGEGNYLYFVFNSTDDLELPVDIESKKKSCAVVSGKNVNKVPTKNDLEWVIDTEREQGDFVEGPNYLGLYCSDPHDKLMRIRIGGAPLLVPYFILAVFAFFAF